MVLCVWTTAKVPAAPFAFSSNHGENSVTVIDIATRASLATIPVGSEPVGVASGHNKRCVYITNPKSKNFSVIATRGLEVTTQIATTITSCYSTSLRASYWQRLR
ncbi:MAG: hypothetical protein E2O35_06195 [Proteobacteria bacterium]|nr:MAG: hypothetical protein E2O35_06195 [Pseudomonadota bacterium]